MAGRCCARMERDLSHTCAHHPDRLDCPDCFIAEVRGGYGLKIDPNAGGGVIEINFCLGAERGFPPSAILVSDAPDHPHTDKISVLSQFRLTTSRE